MHAWIRVQRGHIFPESRRPTSHIILQQKIWVLQELHLITVVGTGETTVVVVPSKRKWSSAVILHAFLAGIELLTIRINVVTQSIRIFYCSRLTVNIKGCIETCLIERSSFKIFKNRILPLSLQYVCTCLLGNVSKEDRQFNLAMLEGITETWEFSNSFQ